MLDLKENRGKLFVIVDAGMNDLLRPALYGAFHRVEPVATRERPTRRADVVGPVCETGDFLARDRNLEVPDPGELYVVRDAGAYGFVMSSNYNMRPRAAEALVENGQLRLIRRRETFEDLIGHRNRLTDGTGLFNAENAEGRRERRGARRFPDSSSAFSADLCVLCV